MEEVSTTCSAAAGALCCTLAHSLQVEHSVLLLVCCVCSVYPSTPLLGNRSTGVWYIPHNPSSNECYFKSTDGHCGHWQFSVNRLNLHVLQLAITHGAIAIVDSTRQGKSLPDAFSRTLPIWCAVMNRTIRTRQLQQRQQQSASSDIHATAGCTCDNSSRTLCRCWSTAHFPLFISASEQQLISKQLPEWTQLLLSSSIDFTAYLTLHKPLRCLWVNTDSNLNTWKDSYMGNICGWHLSVAARPTLRTSRTRSFAKLCSLVAAVLCCVCCTC